MTLKYKSIPLLLTLTLTLTLTLLVPFVLSDGSAAYGGRKEAAGAVGGWLLIKNLKAAEVQEVAQFAMSEHNKQANAKLELERVVRGETKVVSGTNYRLVIAAKDGGVSTKYEAIVWVKPWEHYRNLNSFIKL
ncbi:hypothetical protein CsSME_00031199 [Camellia sinensis var. sinensis]